MRGKDVSPMDQKPPCVSLAAAGRLSVWQLCADFAIIHKIGPKWLNRDARQGAKGEMSDHAVPLHVKMHKSLGSKRHEMGEDQIKRVTRAFGDFTPIDRQPVEDEAAPPSKSTLGRPCDKRV